MRQIRGDEFPKEGKSVIVFTSTKCFACIPILHIFHTLSDIYGHKYGFYIVDALKERELCEQYSIKEVPTVLIMNGDKIMNHIQGQRERIYYERMLV